ncbi:pentapeptide repeat-containing protein [Streptomyces erythrochromogenes]|uniref:pentapeptide repeat-containing protein n=1 Tax=Streptomyces erythrochromogenes TaxID=285574 RepID=UPI00369BD38E
MTATRRPPSAPDSRELRLWKVGRALTVTFAAAVLAAGSVFYGLVVLLDFQKIDTTAKLDAKTLFELVKLSFGVVAGAGALVALVVAYRRQRVDEAGAHREATRLHTERFSQAVDKLGSDSPAVRLGGVHALAGLADDAPDDSLRQTCIDVLCAYLQLPFTPDPGSHPDQQEEHHRYLAFRKVRHTILRLIGDHYRRPRGTHRSWQGCDLDLTGVTIDCNIDFSGTVFSGGTVNFSDATFSSGIVNFQRAVCTGGTVYFGGTTFAGSTVSFSHSSFAGGEIRFDRAIFARGTVYFHDVTFSTGTVHFGQAAFSGSTVYFDDATFSGGGGPEDGMVSFSRSTFSDGSVSFSRATFSGSTIHFSSAAFSGSEVRFNDAEFSGGSLSYLGASFTGGEVSFDGATFTGSRVSFHAASGPAPRGLLSAVGTPVPATVRMPWVPSPRSGGGR